MGRARPYGRGRPPHLDLHPSLGAPVGHELVRFHGITRRLREECPWDREQTHTSLARYAVEETYELVEAIAELGPDGAGDDELVGELGDVLLQVVLHAAIAEQEGRFSLADVAREISDKMIRRHPHVFGSVDGRRRGRGASRTGRRSRRPSGGHDAAPPGLDGVDRRGVPGTCRPCRTPSSSRKAAAKGGFDWDDARGTARQGGRGAGRGHRGLRRRRASCRGRSATSSSRSSTWPATGKVDPEVALRQARRKFRRRVRAVDRLATERGIDTATCGEAALDQLWDEVKDLESTAQTKP